MPFLYSMAIGLLTFIASRIIAKVLLGLGIGIVSYIGMGVVVSYLMDQVTASFNLLWAPVLQMAALVKFDVAVNIIFGAINARLGLWTVGAALRKFQIVGAPPEGEG